MKKDNTLWRTGTDRFKNGPFTMEKKEGQYHVYSPTGAFIADSDFAPLVLNGKYVLIREKGKEKLRTLYNAAGEIMPGTEHAQEVILDKYGAYWVRNEEGLTSYDNGAKRRKKKSMLLSYIALGTLLTGTLGAAGMGLYTARTNNAAAAKRLNMTTVTFLGTSTHQKETLALFDTDNDLSTAELSAKIKSRAAAGGLYGCEGAAQSVADWRKSGLYAFRPCNLKVKTKE